MNEDDVKDVVREKYRPSGAPSEEWRGQFLLRWRRSRGLLLRPDHVDIFTTRRRQATCRTSR